MTDRRPPGYPVTLQLADRLCVVVGGGQVALRKVRGLSAAGARVRVVAPGILPEIAALAHVETLERAFVPADLDGALLAFAATDEAAVNEAVATAARERGILINQADRGDEGDFQLPAVIRRGALTVAVASDGSSPALAAAIRDELALRFGPEWATVCEIVAALRQKQLTAEEGIEYNQKVVCHLLAAGLPGLVAAGDEAAADRLLRRVAGHDISLAALGIRLGKGTT